MKTKLYRLLRWSEKYTKTDMMYLLEGGFWLTLAKGLSTLASFLSSVAFANLLPVETYGTYRYVLSIASLLAIPTLYGVEVSLTRSIAKGNYADTKPALYARLKWGVLGAIASLGVAGYYYFFTENDILCIAFLIVAIFTPFMDSFHLYASILNGRKKFNALARDEVTTRMSVAILLAALVFFTDNILLVLFVFFFFTTVFRFFFLQHTIRTEPKNNLSDPNMLNYGMHLTVMSIFSRVSTQIDKVLVFHYVGAAALAAFYLSFTPMKITLNLLGGLTTLALPKFSEHSIESLRKTLPGKLIRLYIIVIPIVICYELLAPFFFQLLYPLYPDAIFMSQLIFLQILFFPFTLFHTAVTALEEKKQLYINSSVYALLRISLLLFLVPAYGAMGAIAALLITPVVSNTLLVYFFFKPSAKIT